MKIKRLICLMMCAVIIAAFASCGKNDGETDAQDASNGATQVQTMDEGRVHKEAGKISSSVYSAEYKDDGSLNLIVAIHNGTQYSKILKNIQLLSLKDDSDRLIAENVPFIPDDKTYLMPNEISYVECNIEKDQVKIKTSLNSLTSSITLQMYGCVKNGENPQKSDKEEFTASVISGEFSTEVGSFSGSVCIMNCYKTDKAPKTISFDIVTENGTKVNKKTVVINNDNTIKAGGTITLNVGISADEVDSDLAEKCDFNTLLIKNLKVK